MKHFLALTAVSVSFSTFAIAQTQRDLDSHVHGAAALNVAIDESSVFIELNTPWNNLVGFEHAPENDEQHALVDSTLEQLNDPTKLFLFDAGDCTVDEVMVENSMSSDSHSDENEMHDDAHGDEHNKEHDDAHGDEHDKEHDDAHGDEHDKEHDDAHGDEHDKEHDDAHGDEHDKEHDDEHGDDHADESGTHSTVLANYSYTCKQIDKLSTIDISLFSLWSGFEDMDVQLIGSKGQARAELNPGNTVLDLGSVN